MNTSHTFQSYHSKVNWFIKHPNLLPALRPPLLLDPAVIHLFRPSHLKMERRLLGLLYVLLLKLRALPHLLHLLHLPELGLGRPVLLGCQLVQLVLLHAPALVLPLLTVLKFIEHVLLLLVEVLHPLLSDDGGVRVCGLAEADALSLGYPRHAVRDRINQLIFESHPLPSALPRGEPHALSGQRRLALVLIREGRLDRVLRGHLTCYLPWPYLLR